MYLSALSLALNRPGAVSLEQVVASLFAAGEQGAWYDPSAANVTWRRNLLTRTEEFGNATGWQLWNSTQLDSNAAVAPDGTTTADLLKQGNTSTFFLVGSLQSTVTVGEYYTFSVYAKDAGGRYLLMRTQTMTSPSELACIDLQDSSYTARAGVSVAITALPNSWFRIVLTGLLTTQSATGQWQFGINQSEAVALQTYQGDGTSGIYLWGAQLERGSTPTAYQRIVTPEITYLADVQSQPLLFQGLVGDFVGATPVTAVEQPVGLILDRRKGLVLGSEQVADPEFSNSGAWTAQSSWVVSGGKATYTTGLLEYVESNADVTFTSGKWYKITYTVSGIASGFAIFALFSKAATTNYLGSYVQHNLNGSYSVYYLAATTTTGLRIYGNAGSTAPSFSIDNISVKLLDGNHAYQTTSAARPVLRARYNLLTYSEQFNNAAYPTSGLSITSNSIAAPDGTTTADLATATAGAGRHQIRQGNTSTNNATHTLSVYVKAGTHNFLHLSFYTGGLTYFTAIYDLSLGQVTQSAANLATYSGATITAVPNAAGWYRCTLTGNFTSSDLGNASFGFAGSSTGNTLDSSGIPTFTATGAETVYLWGADLRVGTSAGDYQRIAAATDYATTSTITGQPFRPYLLFDGTDDGLITAGFAGTTMDFFQGHYHDRSKTTGQVIQFDMGGAYFGPTVESGGASAAYTLLGSPTFRNNGADETLSNRGDAWTKLTGTPKVLGTQSVALSPWTLTNLCSYPTAPAFNPKINLYGCIIRQSLTASQRASVETYLASKTGVTL